MCIQEIDNQGAIWVKLDRSFINTNFDLFLCFLYIPPQNSVYFSAHSEGYFEYLERTVRQYSSMGSITVCGDMNARCGDLNDYCVEDASINRFFQTPDIDDITDYNIPYRFSTDHTLNSSGTKLIDVCLNTDLKIVNGRCGDDAGKGEITFMTDNGQSLIDYVLVTPELFPFIHNFVVHDFHSLSPHAPIQVIFNFDMERPNKSSVHYTYENISWCNDTDKNASYLKTLTDNLINFQTIADSIVSSNVCVDQGIDAFSDLLYNCAFINYGKVKTNIRKNGTERKFRSPWFNNECETARKNFKIAKRLFYKDKSNNNRLSFTQARKSYNSVKKKAKSLYKLSQQDKMHTYSRTDPQKFWNEIKKFNKNKSNSNISSEEFFQHFKDLFPSDEIFKNPNVECNLDQFFNENLYTENLDKDFTIDEVLKAISSLKRGKSPGMDNLVPEIFIDGKNILTPILCTIFNFIYNNGIYPKSWTKGVIVPVPKKGDKEDVNNYRGITLTSIFSKIFSILLDNRLRNWLDSTGQVSDFQFGFRNNRSTIDCIFVLNSLINKIIHQEKRRLYCAFVDFKKAFDLVYRNGMIFKLLKLKVSSKFTKMIQAIYSDVKSCVRTKINGNAEPNNKTNKSKNESHLNDNNSYSDFFATYNGVKQGEPLSPLLFILFINDMYDHLYTDGIDSLDIDDIKLFMLLFADDTVLFSYSAAGLQTLLNKLYDYCSEWGLSVNIDKTKVMVFNKNNGQNQNVIIKYAGVNLEVTQKFTYLGVTLSSNGNFYKTQKTLSEQASRALYSLNRLFDHISFKVKDKIRLFDAMIVPILMYGCESWGFHESPDIEKIHIKFLKQILGVGPKTTNLTIYGETGRMPLHVTRSIRIIKYWSKIKSDPNSLPFKIYESLPDSLSSRSDKNWRAHVNNLLQNLGLAYLFHNETASNSEVNMIIQRIKDTYTQQWVSNVNSSSKLNSYKLFKKSLTAELYLDVINNDTCRKYLTRLRCSSHKLCIEEGRYKNIPREQRMCTKCNMKVIENEYHFLLVCPRYHVLRTKYLPRYYLRWPTLNKFVQLMSSENVNLLIRLSKFNHQAWLLRNEINDNN